MKTVSILALFFAVSCSTAALRAEGVAWGDPENGLGSLSFSLNGKERNLINPGRRLGHMTVKGTASGKAFTLDTTNDVDRIVENTPARLVRRWKTEAGLLFEESFSRAGEEILWTTRFKNLSDGTLTVTDFGLCLPLGKVRRDLPARQNVNTHVSVCGHGSSIYWVPYDGLGECAVLLPDEHTSIEYFTEGDWFYIHSSSVRGETSDWRIPATELKLAAGADKSYTFRFFRVKNHDAVLEAVYSRGGVNFRVAPGMTVPRGETVRIAVRSKSLPESLFEEHPSETKLDAWRKAANGYVAATVRFDRPGENRLAVAWKDGRTMYLDFFITQDIETIVKKRSAFISKRQQHRNPEKWYDGLYSLFDLRLGRLLSPDDTGNLRWQYMVGGSDDPSNCKPLYVSEKNVVYPDADEIAALEYYERNFVWGKLQRTDKEFPYPCGIYGSDNWHRNRSGKAGGYMSGGSGKERMWRTFDYVTHLAIYFNLHRIARENPSMTRYLDDKGYLRRAYLTAMAFFEVPYNIEMGKQWAFRGWCDWAYKQGNFHERYILDILDALEEYGWQEEADRLRREWEKKVTYMIYEDPWPFGSEMFVDRTAFESSYYIAEYALTRDMVPQEKFWYDKNAKRWYSYTSYPKEPMHTMMANQLAANLALRGIYGTSYSTCGTAWTGLRYYALDYMTQMGGVALLDYAVRFAPAERQSELLLHGYNSLLASWALVNCGEAASGHGYWRKGAEFDGAAGWGFMPYPKGRPFMKHVTYRRGPWDADGEIDHGFVGGLHGAGCYVANDPVFGEIAYGGELKSEASRWRVVPRDGARRYLAFPMQNRFEMRLLNNGFAKDGYVDIAKDLSKISFKVEQRGTTGLQKIEFRSLPKGDWTVRVKGRKNVNFRSAGGRTAVSFPCVGGESVEIAR